MLHHSLLIHFTAKKGRGVFTNQYIAANTVIEVAPVIVLTEAERHLAEQTILHDYIFAWGNDALKAAVGLGYSSMYNHATPSNCEYVLNYDAQTISIITMKDIAAGEELTINYSTHWYEEKPVWFDAAD
jgi:SET domain-containing protein